MKYKVRYNPIKDGYTNKDIKKWSEEFADKCRNKSCMGIMAVTAPHEEDIVTGMYCDILTGQALLKTIIQDLCQGDYNLMINVCIWTALYLENVKKCHINEDNSSIDQELLESDMTEKALKEVFSRMKDNKHLR